MSDRLASLIPVRCMPGTPWVRNQTALSDSVVALVTTAGVTVKGQPAFREGLIGGDFEFRMMHRDVVPQKLSFSKYMIDRRLALLDANILFPLERLRELAQEGVIKGVSEHHFSFYGYASDPNRIMDGSAKDVARRLRYEGVDKVLVMTATVLSQEIAFLVQRAIEEEGIPTVSLAYTEEAVQALKPPRACLLKKGSLSRQEAYLEEGLQMNLLRLMLNQFDAIQVPGTLMPVTLEMPLMSSARTKASAHPRAHSVQKDLFQ